MRIWIYSIFFLVIISCQQTEKEASLINTAHLDSLYENIKMQSGDSVGIIHIYSEAPDYHWVDDADEGIACVDDVARAAIFYLRDYNKNQTDSSLAKAQRLLAFVLNMQAENGFFYNFIWKDGSINRDFKTSVAEPNWWSWRALWALSEALEHLPKGDQLRPDVEKIYNRLASVTVAYCNQTYKDSTEQREGFTQPTWLPYGTASDQAAIQIIGLLHYYKITGQDSVKNCIQHLANGLLMMQVQNNGQFPHGAFLSWQNLWHAYGNAQAHALLLASQVLKDTMMANQALQEVDFYFAEVEKRGYRNEFKVRKTGNTVEIYDEKQFSQIAYGVQHMVAACVEAYKITGKEKYWIQAKSLAQWFFGNNPAKAQMYDPKTGRCFDGIESADRVNKNAGAESTIEALLTLQLLESK